MTSEDYGNAYKKGHVLTTRLLVTRGMSWDCAQETAQAAWVKGWEKRSQLRDSKTVVRWVNTIALNIFRTNLRHEPFLQELPELTAPPEKHLAAIDVQLILQSCKKTDRIVLQSYYLEDHPTEEIARAQGLSETAVRLRLLRARRRAFANTVTAISQSTAAATLAKCVNG